MLELVLQDDRHLVGIIHAQIVGHRNAEGCRLKLDIEMMIARRRAEFRGHREHVENDAAQGALRQIFIIQLNVAQCRPASLRDFS
jgi:hypothetical protein